MIKWEPSYENKFVTKTPDQPEPETFFPRSLWGRMMKDPGNEVELLVQEKCPTPVSPGSPSLAEPTWSSHFSKSEKTSSGSDVYERVWSLKPGYVGLSEFFSGGCYR